MCWIVIGSAAALAADPPGTPASRAALAACHAAEAATTPEEASRLLADAERQAAAAQVTDPQDALAHFAEFCAVGERLRRSGVAISALWELPRVRAAVDRTLALAPDFPDALAGKGAMLVELPRLAGGDATEGERLLRRALAIDPDYLGPRADLVRVLERRGARDEARREAATLLAVAERKGNPRDVAMARGLVSRLAD